MARKRPVTKEKAVENLIRELLQSQPELTFDDVQEAFRCAARTLSDAGILKQHKDEHRLNGLPLEWAVKRIFKQIQKLDSRKAWNRFHEPKHPNVHEFIFERGFRDDDTDAVRRDDAFHSRLVFEVKSHSNHGATIEDLRQLEDWVGRLNRSHQKTLTDKKLKDRLRSYRPLLTDIPERERILAILNPYKGVLVLNHEWNRDRPSEAFGANEQAFASEQNFCLLSYRDLLQFRDAIVRYDMDAYYFLEEIDLTSGILTYTDGRALAKAETPGRGN